MGNPPSGSRFPLPLRTHAFDQTSRMARHVAFHHADAEVPDSSLVQVATMIPRDPAHGAGTQAQADRNGGVVQSLRLQRHDPLGPLLDLCPTLGPLLGRCDQKARVSLLRHFAHVHPTPCVTT